MILPGVSLWRGANATDICTNHTKQPKETQNDHTETKTTETQRTTQQTADTQQPQRDNGDYVSAFSQSIVPSVTDCHFSPLSGAALVQRNNHALVATRTVSSWLGTIT